MTFQMRNVCMCMSFDSTTLELKNLSNNTLYLHSIFCINTYFIQGNKKHLCIWDKRSGNSGRRATLRTKTKTGRARRARISRLVSLRDALAFGSRYRTTPTRWFLFTVFCFLGELAILLQFLSGFTFYMNANYRKDLCFISCFEVTDWITRC